MLGLTRPISELLGRTEIDFFGTFNSERVRTMSNATQYYSAAEYPEDLDDSSDEEDEELVELQARYVRTIPELDALVKTQESYFSTNDRGVNISKLPNVLQKQRVQRAMRKWTAQRSIWFEHRMSETVAGLQMARKACAKMNKAFAAICEILDSPLLATAPESSVVVPGDLIEAFDLFLRNNFKGGDLTEFRVAMNIDKLLRGEELTEKEMNCFLVALYQLGKTVYVCNVILAALIGGSVPILQVIDDNTHSRQFIQNFNMVRDDFLAACKGWGIVDHPIFKRMQVISSLNDKPELTLDVKNIRKAFTDDPRVICVLNNHYQMLRLLEADLAEAPRSICYIIDESHVNGGWTFKYPSKKKVVQRDMYRELVLEHCSMRLDFTANPAIAFLEHNQLWSNHVFNCRPGPAYCGPDRIRCTTVPANADFVEVLRTEVVKSKREGWIPMKVMKDVEHANPWGLSNLEEFLHPQFIVHNAESVNTSQRNLLDLEEFRDGWVVGIINQDGITIRHSAMDSVFTITGKDGIEHHPTAPNVRHTHTLTFKTLSVRAFIYWVKVQNFQLVCLILYKKGGEGTCLSAPPSVFEDRGIKGGLQVTKQIIHRSVESKASRLAQAFNRPTANSATDYDPENVCTQSTKVKGMLEYVADITLMDQIDEAKKRVASFNIPAFLGESVQMLEGRVPKNYTHDCPEQKDVLKAMVKPNPNGKIEKKLLARESISMAEVCESFDAHAVFDRPLFQAELEKQKKMARARPAAREAAAGDVLADEGVLWRQPIHANSELYAAFVANLVDGQEKRKSAIRDLSGKFNRNQLINGIFDWHSDRKPGNWKVTKGETAGLHFRMQSGNWYVKYNN